MACRYRKARVYGSGFLIFSDTARAQSAERLTGDSVIYNFTTDSIGVGEDWSNASAVAQFDIAARHSRTKKKKMCWRQGDRNEVAEAWRTIMTVPSRAGRLILPRQNNANLWIAPSSPCFRSLERAYILADAKEGDRMCFLLWNGQRGRAVRGCIRAVDQRRTKSAGSQHSSWEKCRPSE